MRKRVSLGIAASLTLLAMTPHTQQGPSGQGPFSFRTQHPVYLQTIQLLPERPQTLAAGVLEARVDSSYSNIFERVFGTADELNIDMELERLGVIFAYGLP